MSIPSGIPAVSVGMAVGAIIWVLWPDTIKPSPRAGERGRRRSEWIARGGLVPRLEMLLRVLAGHLDGLGLPWLRPKLERKLVEAGRPLGLDGSDFVAVSMLAGITGLVLGSLIAAWLGKSAGVGALVGVAVGISLPIFKLDEAVSRRRILVERGLPYAVDLAALSLEAGLDFAGALSQVISKLRPQDPIRFELEQMLRMTSLGRSRRDALWQFAKRVPTVQVRQFAQSVIQAEERGTPLARVLSTQADVMRTKRSQAAEQAAARAGVLILGPLMLIFACVFLILLGPFAIQFIRGEMF